MVAKAPIFTIIDFKKLCIVEYDALEVSIGGVLSQEGKPVACGLYQQEIRWS